MRQAVDKKTYPNHLIFAGRKYCLTPADWDDYYYLINAQRHTDAGLDRDSQHLLTKAFLKSSGYLHEYC